MSFWCSKMKKFLKFFFIRVFFHRHWRFTGQQGKGGHHLLFHSITSTRSRTLRHLFATLHVRWLSRLFNRNACVYKTVTRWDFQPYQISAWLIDWLMMQCLFVYLMNWFWVFVTVVWHGKPVDLNSYRLSHVYYKRTD